MFIPSWEYWFLWNFPLAQQMETGHVNFNYSIICMFRDLHKKFQMIIITFFKKDKIISIYFWRHCWPLLLIISLFDFMCFLKNYCVLSKKICFKSGTISDGSLSFSGETSRGQINYHCYRWRSHSRHLPHNHVTQFMELGESQPHIQYDFHRTKAFSWLQRFYCCHPSVADRPAPPVSKTLKQEGSLPALIRDRIS